MATVRDLSGNGRVDVDRPQQTFTGRTTTGDDAKTITPSDSAWLTNAANQRDVCKMIHATGGGTVAYENDTGLACNINISTNSYAPIRARRILSTGTTATGITAYF